MFTIFWLILYFLILISHPQFGKSVLIKDVKWCKSPFCKDPIYHTICKWGKPCYPAENCATSKEFTKKVKDIVLEMHNDIRNKVALGKDPQIPQDVRTAADMQALSWHIHLEFVARCFTRRCHFYTNDCIAIPDFPQVGQNLFQMVLKDDEAEEPNITEVVIKGIKAWHSEIINIPSEAYKKYKKSDKPSGNFTQMIWSKTTHVGCGLSEYRKPDVPTVKFFLACHYGTQGNINDKPIYSVGESCSKCSKQEKCNEKWKGLCGQEIEYALKCPCED